MRTNASRREFLALPAAPAQPKLDYRPLGKTGVKVTTVGFGCMVTSDGSVIQRAADLGINYFDTARIYSGGNNERMVGAALKGRREKVVLSSKTLKRSKQQALEDLDTSLRELATDRLDIWHLHDVRRPDQITDELLEAQQTAKQQGKVRFAGVSFHTNQAEMMRAAIDKGFDVVLAAYNFTMDAALDPVLAEANRAGVGVVAMKVMAGGYRRSAPYYPTPDELRARLRREGAMLAALKWVVRNPSVHTTVPSMVDMDQLDENLRAMAEPFTPADQKVLTAQLDRIRPLYCRMCGKCEGACAQGLPVADVLRFLMYADGYGQFALGRQKFLELPREAARVRCNLCPSCSVRCPFGVNVAARLGRAQELFA